ncbi:MAG: acylneuraminate cytidylyltransferase family protein [Planctomycetota bacterium]
MTDNLYRFVGIIPARAGSTRLKRKNLRKIGDRTLVQIAVDCAMKVSRLEKIVVSSDGQEILTSVDSRNDPRIVRHRRPGYLSLDDSAIEDLIAHIMDEHKWSTHAVLLNPTSPFRRAGTIDRCINAITRLGYESVATVTATRAHHYLWDKERGAQISPFHERPRPRSQDLTPALVEHGACFVTSRRLAKAGVLTGGWSYPVTTGKYQAIDIDTQTDLIFARSLYPEYARSGGCESP